jgi:ribosomal protein S8
MGLSRQKSRNLYHPATTEIEHIVKLIEESNFIGQYETTNFTTQLPQNVVLKKKVVHASQEEGSANIF